MLQASPGAQSTDSNDHDGRRQVALDRIQLLLARTELGTARAWKFYYWLQGLTVGLAALTPCLIVLAKENPNNGVLNWLQLFFPAIAAIAAGLSHIFHWREDAVRFTTLGEAIRSELWRFQTRTGEFAGTSEEQALNVLVTQVDDLNLKSLAQWAAVETSQVTPLATAAKAAPAAPEH
jgi:hypothetical protein